MPALPTRADLARFDLKAFAGVTCARHATPLLATQEGPWCMAGHPVEWNREA